MSDTILTRDEFAAELDTDWELLDEYLIGEVCDRLNGAYNAALDKIAAQQVEIGRLRDRMVPIDDALVQIEDWLNDIELPPLPWALPDLVRNLRANVDALAMSEKGANDDANGG